MAYVKYNDPVLQNSNVMMVYASDTDIYYVAQRPIIRADKLKIRDSSGNEVSGIEYISMSSFESEITGLTVTLVNDEGKVKFEVAITDGKTPVSGKDSFTIAVTTRDYPDEDFSGTSKEFTIFLVCCKEPLDSTPITPTDITVNDQTTASGIDYSVPGAYVEIADREFDYSVVSGSSSFPNVTVVRDDRTYTNQEYVVVVETDINMPADRGNIRIHYIPDGDGYGDASKPFKEHMGNGYAESLVGASGTWTNGKFSVCKSSSGTRTLRNCPYLADGKCSYGKEGGCYWDEGRYEITQDTWELEYDGSSISSSSASYCDSAYPPSTGWSNGVYIMGEAELAYGDKIYTYSGDTPCVQYYMSSIGSCVHTTESYNLQLFCIKDKLSKTFPEWGQYGGTTVNGGNPSIITYDPQTNLYASGVVTCPITKDNTYLLSGVGPIKNVGILSHPLIGSYLDYAVSIGKASTVARKEGTYGLAVPDPVPKDDKYDWAGLYTYRPKHTAILPFNNTNCGAHTVTSPKMTRSRGRFISYNYKCEGSSTNTELDIKAYNIALNFGGTLASQNPAETSFSEEITIDVSESYDVISSEHTIVTDLCTYSDDEPWMFYTIITPDTDVTSKYTYTVAAMDRAESLTHAAVCMDFSYYIIYDDILYVSADEADKPPTVSVCAGYVDLPDGSSYTSDKPTYIPIMVWQPVTHEGMYGIIATKDEDKSGYILSKKEFTSDDFVKNSDGIIPGGYTSSYDQYKDSNYYSYFTNQPLLPDMLPTSLCYGWKVSNDNQMDRTDEYGYTTKGWLTYTKVWYVTLQDGTIHEICPDEGDITGVVLPEYQTFSATYKHTAEYYTELTGDRFTGRSDCLEEKMTDTVTATASAKFRMGVSGTQWVVSQDTSICNDKDWNSDEFCYCDDAAAGIGSSAHLTAYTASRSDICGPDNDFNDYKEDCKTWPTTGGSKCVSTIYNIVPAMRASRNLQNFVTRRDMAKKALDSSSEPTCGDASVSSIKVSNTYNTDESKLGPILYIEYTIPSPSGTSFMSSNISSSYKVSPESTGGTRESSPLVVGSESYYYCGDLRLPVAWRPESYEDFVSYVSSNAYETYKRSGKSRLSTSSPIRFEKPESTESVIDKLWLYIPKSGSSESFNIEYSMQDYHYRDDHDTWNEYTVTDYHNDDTTKVMAGIYYRNTKTSTHTINHTNSGDTSVIPVCAVHEGYISTADNGSDGSTTVSTSFTGDFELSVTPGAWDDPSVTGLNINKNFTTLGAIYPFEAPDKDNKIYRSAAAVGKIHSVNVTLSNADQPSDDLYPVEPSSPFVPYKIHRSITSNVSEYACTEPVTDPDSLTPSTPCYSVTTDDGGKDDEETKVSVDHAKVALSDIDIVSDKVTYVDTKPKPVNVTVALKPKPYDIIDGEVLTFVNSYSQESACCGGNNTSKTSSVVVTRLNSECSWLKLNDQDDGFPTVINEKEPDPIGEGSNSVTCCVYSHSEVASDKGSSIKRNHTHTTINYNTIEDLIASVSSIKHTGGGGNDSGDSTVNTDLCCTVKKTRRSSGSIVAKIANVDEGTSSKGRVIVRNILDGNDPEPPNTPISGVVGNVIPKVFSDIFSPRDTTDVSASDAYIITRETLTIDEGN